MSRQSKQCVFTATAAIVFALLLAIGITSAEERKSRVGTLGPYMYEPKPADEAFAKFADKTAMIPGCGSVTEIVSQFSKGAALCKLFPAKQLGGPGFVKAIDPAIHKTISIVPTGGTNPGNIPDYIDAGVLVVGGSFGLIEKSIMKIVVEQQDYDLLVDEFVKVKQLIDEHRKKKWPDIDFKTASVETISKFTGRNFNLS